MKTFGPRLVLNFISTQSLEEQLYMIQVLVSNRSDHIISDNATYKYLINANVTPQISTEIMSDELEWCQPINDAFKRLVLI